MSINTFTRKQAGQSLKAVRITTLVAGILLSGISSYAVSADQQPVTVSNVPSATLPTTGTDTTTPSATPTTVSSTTPATAQAAQPVAPQGDALNLTTFTPQSLYNHADGVVKTVILILLFASLLSWTTWLGKTLDLWSRSRRMKKNLQLLNSQNSLRQNVEFSSTSCQALHNIATAELRQVKPAISLHSVSTLQERVHARMQRVEASEARHATRGASILATTSAVTPFIGLFGTVWGIMHSFMSIAQSHTTNLSVVAPGIAEALFATALGLVVAIPAVILYNILGRQITGYRMLLADAVTYTLCLLSHDLDALPKETSGHLTSAA